MLERQKFGSSAARKLSKDKRVVVAVAELPNFQTSEPLPLYANLTKQFIF